MTGFKAFKYVFVVLAVLVVGVGILADLYFTRESDFLDALQAGFQWIGRFMRAAFRAGEEAGP